MKPKNPKMDRAALNRATLARQMLLAREKATIVAATERLVGLQAQWPSPPFVGLWTRVVGFKRDHLRKALASHDVVRATTMRGTIHVVSASDYAAFRPALQPLLTRAMTSILKDRLKGIDVTALVEEARGYFAEGHTFTELRAFLMGLHPKGDERAMGFAVRTHLPLAMVPTDAKWCFPGDAKFIVAEPWIGRSLGDADAGTRALALRYFAAFGPATVTDLQTWSGLKGLAKVVAGLRSELVTFDDERGRELFDLPDAPRPDGATAAPARFIPEYDNLVLGHDDRTRFIAKEHRAAIYLPGLKVAPTFLLDGFVAGTWKIERAKASAELVVEPFAALSKKDKEALTLEAEALLQLTDDDADRRKVVFRPRIGRR
jgi:hypothetical protein